MLIVEEYSRKGAGSFLMIRKCFSKIALLLIFAATVAYGQSVSAPGRVSGKVTTTGVALQPMPR